VGRLTEPQGGLFSGVGQTLQGKKEMNIVESASGNIQATLLSLFHNSIILHAVCFV